ncbi:hypothetical protein [Serratia phage vB_SmaM_Hera]|uniref:Uncharacterized protein n=2 Tax=Myosmarvirus MTx TaxID=2846180 RepID=A0A482MGT6_9CAUD|nr:tail fiber protein [Serratia phage MTx]QBQ72353.1 hypothetical protein CPT_MTx_047 [Serratia phage MTx]QPX74719.1 hypothetical protein [Serratia phage vB_SmaM_Hera]
MAQTILASIFSPKGLKVIDEKTGAHIWASMQVTKVQPVDDSETAEIPFAVGRLSDPGTTQKTSDSDILPAKVIKPAMIEITAIVDDILFNSIINVFNDVTHTLTVTSKSIITNSMCLVGIEADQTPDKLNKTSLVLTLEQVQPPTKASFNPSQSADQSILGTRVQAPESVSDTVSGMVDGIKNRLGI